MRRLNDTVARLGAMRAMSFTAGPSGTDRLGDLQSFGSNPGALRARFYTPERLEEGAPLVVVLHGCTQNAVSYDQGSGWSRLADEHGFALLFPEQLRANNANLCFNWFSVGDARRNSGEALSIRQMAGAMIDRHRLDPARVYVTGLSAGGAMTSVMLATYPEMFAGGAIIAGLPFGTATSVPEAFDRMRAHGGPRGAALGELVAKASDFRGPWPTISVWHGGSDATVSSANADLVLDQWRAIHGLGEAPDTSELVAGHRRRAWRNAEGLEVVEEYRIAGLGHGTPLHTTGPEACGVAGPYMLEAGISSTRRIASFWGLRPGTRTAPSDSSETVGNAHFPLHLERLSPAGCENGKDRRPERGVAGVIEDALRAAGLMR
jgi:poly(hydroxyalkanoate) depolymerase family esterase